MSVIYKSCFSENQLNYLKLFKTMKFAAVFMKLNQSLQM